MVVRHGLNSAIKFFLKDISTLWLGGLWSSDTQSRRETREDKKQMTSYYKELWKKLKSQGVGERFHYTTHIQEQTVVREIYNAEMIRKELENLGRRNEIPVQNQNSASTIDNLALLAEGRFQMFKTLSTLLTRKWQEQNIEPKMCKIHQ